MSIDYLYDLERDLENGKELYACPGTSRNQWIVSKKLDELPKIAKRAADFKKIGVDIVRLVHKADAVTQLFLVPTQVGDPGPRGEPVVQWSIVETKEAAELVRDVKRGPSPFFGIEVQERVEPSGKS